MITITTHHAGQWYASLYFGSLVVAFLIFLFAGWQRKYPLTTLLLIQVTMGLFLMTGSWLGTFSMDDIAKVFSEGQLPDTRARTSFFALLMGWVGIGLAQRLLGFRHSVIDLYAWAIPAALILNRIACLLAGCCYGLPTQLPWGVSYADQFPIFQHHQATGMIAEDALRSAAVHPVPLYHILSFLLITAIGFRFRKSWKAGGNLTSYDFHSSNQKFNDQSTKFDGAVSIFWGRDYKNTGIKVGGYLGKQDILGGRYNTSALLPIIQVRGGPREKLFFEAGFGDHNTQGYFASTYHIGGGVGLQLLDPELERSPLVLKFGATNMGKNWGAYIAPEFEFGQLFINPTIWFGKKPPIFGVDLGFWFNKPKSQGNRLPPSVKTNFKKYRHRKHDFAILPEEQATGKSPSGLKWKEK